MLSNGYVAALLSTGTIEGVERHLRDAERWLDEPDAGAGTERDPDRMVVADDAEFRRLPAGTAVHRAGLALVLGDLAGTVAHAQRALDLLDEDDHVGRGAATALIGLASWASGDLEAAHAAYAECTGENAASGPRVRRTRRARSRWRTSGSPRAGSRDAMRTYEQALQVAPSEQGGPVLRGTRRHVRRDERAPPRAQRPRSRQAAAGAARSWASTTGCRRTPIAGGSPWPASARPRETSTPRSGCSTRRNGSTRRLLPERAPDPGDEGAPAGSRRASSERALALGARAGTVGRGRPHLPARVRAHHPRQGAAGQERGRARQPTLDEASELLERLLRAAEAGDRTGSVIEILVLQALALQCARTCAPRCAPLERALALAEPEGYVRMFVDEGPPMAALLEAAAATTGSRATTCGVC